MSEASQKSLSLLSFNCIIFAGSGERSAIIGATKLQHLDDAVAALTMRLTAAEIAALESDYIPHSVVGFS
jgi:aryl-alcohol dehydrogenase-like predicted oxidoreductase